MSQIGAFKLARTFCLIGVFSISFFGLLSGSQAASASKHRGRSSAKYIARSRAYSTQRHTSAAATEVTEASDKQEPVSVVPFVTTGSANLRMLEEDADQFAARNLRLETQTNPSLAYVEKQTRLEKEALVPSTFDPSLISILNDLARMVQDTNGLKNLKDNGSKEVLALAGQVLAKALVQQNLSSDRIIGPAGERNESTKLTCQSWVSGPVTVAPNLNGSVSAVWAKRRNGLINVTIAGDANGQQAKNGKQVGQFVVLLSGRSGQEKGLDIQSRADVDYWLAELNQITVEADGCSSVTDISSSTAKHLAQKKAGPNSSKTVRAEIKNTKQASLPEINQKTASDREPPPLTSAVKQESGLFRISTNEPEYEGSSSEPVILRPLAHEDVLTGEVTPTGVKEALPEQSNKEAYQPEPSNKEIYSAEQSNRKDFLSVIIPSRLVCPERAVAGEALTVSLPRAVKDGQTQPGLSFNGVPVNSDDEGKAIYNVPEDATPGKSLKVTRTGEPEGLLAVVEVLQPLASSDQPPHIDAVTNIVRPGDILVISGHNFQGVWHKNVVLIDGTKVPVLKACSPVEIKLLIPSDTEPGKHTVSVNCRESVSNAASFESVSVAANMEQQRLTNSTGHRQVSSKHSKKGRGNSML